MGYNARNDEIHDNIVPIEIKSNQQILNLEIYEKDAAVSANLSSQRDRIEIELLCPGEAITLIALVTDDSYRPDLRIQMKSAEMSTFTRGMRAAYPNLFALITVLCVVAIEVYYVRNLALQVVTETPPQSLDWNQTIELIVIPLIVVIIPILLGAIVITLAKKLIARSTSPVAWRFFQTKLSALTGRQHWKDFKKKIDAATKK
jgi:hypothetical protein